jgi:nucleoside-diphosphate-sugar epimerase
LNSFNWEPKISLKEGLTKTYKWIEEQIKSGENTQKFTKSY